MTKSMKWTKTERAQARNMREEMKEARKRRRKEISFLNDGWALAAWLARHGIASNRSSMRERIHFQSLDNIAESNQRNIKWKTANDYQCLSLIFIRYLYGSVSLDEEKNQKEQSSLSHMRSLPFREPFNNETLFMCSFCARIRFLMHLLHFHRLAHGTHSGRQWRRQRHRAK